MPDNATGTPVNAIDTLFNDVSGVHVLVLPSCTKFPFGRIRLFVSNTIISYYSLDLVRFMLQFMWRKMFIYLWVLH